MIRENVVNIKVKTTVIGTSTVAPDGGVCGTQRDLGRDSLHRDEQYMQWAENGQHYRAMANRGGRGPINS
jgi:hypothetical protein